ncbi:tyrosine-type recombinase/integrase [Sinorhizobium meliloti]|uniref:tyrosine-type recombinase/integrase n=1 Tax=Rhizobium meliloti TaxID=382 RepID=UPI00237F4C13|nr:site-specific integrase [Sinorhizobium meliloti]MDE3811633.1 tyrosine-type recombinase/integrase [Sinorhizobium meliloti]
MVKLTNDILKNAEPEKGKRLELRDDQEPGLIFRVTDKGVRTWSIRYRNAAGEQRRKQIGPYPSVSLAKAREEARKIKGTVAGGSDVVAVERLSRAEEKRRRLSTLGGLADAYFDDATLGTHRANAKPKREGTITEEKRIYEKLVKPEFGGEPLTSITHSAIQAFVTKQSRKAKSNGRHCRNIIRQMMSYAVRLGLIEVNPAHDIAVVMPAAKETVVSDEDLRAFWGACIQPQKIEDLALSLNMGAALRMAAVTLQRGGEVIGMAWSEIDRNARTWLIPAERMKGGKAHLVPLSDLALRLLDETALAAEGKVKSAYVFPSPRSEKDKPMDRRAFSRAMNRIVAALQLVDATPHDLRRTGATNLTSERVGIPRFIVSQVLAHSSDTGGAAAVTGKHYDLNDYLPEKRRALDAWAALLEQIVSGEERPNNVVNLSAQSA